MIRNENDFKKIVDQLDIDTKPNDAHRENLRREMLSVFNEAQSSSTRTDAWQILRRTIMKNPISKLAAAAVIVIAVVALVSIVDKSVRPAYALEQTIQANQAIRYIHIKGYGPGQKNDPKEFWVELDESGELKNARWYMPEWDAPEDGAKLVVWKTNKLQIWFQGSKLTRKKPGLATWTDEPSPDWLKDLADKSNPRTALEQLYEQEERGEVQIKIYEPRNRTKPIIVKATYLPQSVLYGKQKILYVDQATKLVTAVDFYKLKDGQYIYTGTNEYYDYNQPIAAEMFELEDEVPAEVRRVDGDIQEIRGLAQGDMTDEEIAVEVVREFFEALMAKDYERAGQIFCGTPAEELQEGWFGKNQVTRIISIDKPTPHPVPGIGGLRVPCKVEIENNGVKSVWEPYGPFVRKVSIRGDETRWEIHGGL